MLTVPETIIAKNIVDASTAGSYRRVFFLGPYARRVSFASQQNRALNLLWALRAKGLLDANDHVAVIGAGLSGVTVTAALFELGCKVTLYESGEGVLTRQGAAKHRYIHPTINRWPEHPVEETTRLPYFDWASDICHDLLLALRCQWDQLPKPVDFGFARYADVVRFVEAGAHVAVETRVPGERGGDRYSIVLVTSGFADEDYGDDSRYPPYWMPDTIENRVARQATNFVVSGCGDGGLIDALRLAHRDFRDGRLLVEVARELSRLTWPSLELIKNAEAQLADSDTEFRAAVKSGSVKLMEVYTEAASRLPDPIEKSLKASLRSNRPGLVTLVSREANPFSPLSAPIHKLLIAHACSNLVITHRSANVSGWTPSELTCESEDDKPGTKYGLHGSVILRHGAAPNFSRFLSRPQEIADLVDRQRKLAADFDLPMWSQGAAKLKVWPPVGEFGRELAVRRSQAEVVIKRTVGMNGYLDLDDADGFRFFYRSNAETDASVRGLPEKLFGFPLGIASIGGDVPIPTTACGALWTSSRSAVPDAVRPGQSVRSSLDGRLGPLVADANGNLFALTAAHVLGEGNLPVHDVGGRSIGRPVRASYVPGEDADLGLIALHPHVSSDPAYAGMPAIGPAGDLRDLFAATVLMQRGSGELARAAVSSTRVSVAFRRPGRGERVVVRNAIRIRPEAGQGALADAGDSGAPVVDENGCLVGIVISRDERFTYIVPAAEFLATNGLTLLTGPVVREKPQQLAGISDAHTRVLDLYAAANRRDQDRPTIDFGEDHGALELAGHGSGALA